MRDPELVARAQRAAARLETAWEQWRALHGLAVAPGQPVVSYVGYSLREPWGEPRVVIGIDADEAEYLAEFLDRDECAQRGPVTQRAGGFQPGSRPHGFAPPGGHQAGSLTAGGQPGAAPAASGQQAGGPGIRQPAAMSEPLDGPADYLSSSRLSAPVSYSRGRQSPDQVRDIAAELAGWNSGELPGQVSEQLTGWPAGLPGASDRPPGPA
jgi:hypothetical protein